MWGTELALLPAQSEAQAGAEIRFQAGVAGDIFVLAVQQVLDIGVGGDSVTHLVPCAEIETCVTGGVRNWRQEAEEVGIGSPAKQGSAKGGAEAASRVGEQEVPGV